jgi:hypothetical protein
MVTVSELVNPVLRAALLAEGEELFKKRARLEARLAALDNLHDCLIDAAALHEINQQRARDLARTDTLAGRSIKLKIFLDSDSYKCLLKHVPDQAPSRAAISEAVLLGHTRVVDCNDVEARDLLVCARSHCPSAVARIAEAIRAVGLIP